MTTWHAFAEAIVSTARRQRRLDREPRITGISTAEYPTAARRPQNSALAPSAELEAFRIDFDWSRGLEQAVEKMERLNSI